MRYCTRCVLPETRPGTTFNKEGVCLACQHFEKRNSIDWDARWEELKTICNNYRGTMPYDCMIPISGGKDSHTQTYIMRMLGMNPLLLTYGDPFTKTNAGIHNLYNVREVFECDHIMFKLSPPLAKKLIRIGFEQLGEPMRFVEKACYTFPIQVAHGLRIPLVVYGEDAYYEYATQDQESVGMNTIRRSYEDIDIGFWRTHGITDNELATVMWDDLDWFTCHPIFLSHYTPWSGEGNYLTAKRYGFRDLSLEWRRIGNIDNYDQIDSIGYVFHFWMKYVKFGFARTTDIACRLIREGKITRQRGIELVKEYDHKLDPRAYHDFVTTLGYNDDEFWGIVNQYWNTEIFEKREGKWALKNPIWEQ